LVKPESEAKWRVLVAEKLMGFLPLSPDYRTTYFYVERLGGEGISEELSGLLLAEAQRAYDDERDIPFLDLYFRFPVRELLEGRSLLDLGCSIGGRSVRLAETLHVPKISGVDILPEDTDVAGRFASKRGVASDFRAGRAENLPFPPESIENIVSYDAFEHVENVEAVLRDCHRVLVPGGHVVAVFPPFGNPFESHLLFSELPALHWLFGGETLAAAQRRVAAARGWPPILPERLASWEKMPSLNGVTRRSFNAAVARTGWDVVYRSACPLFTTGRRARQNPVFRTLRRLLQPLVLVPGARELATDRIAVILRKTPAPLAGQPQAKPN